MDDGSVFFGRLVRGLHENCVITTGPFQPLYGETSGSGEGRRCLKKFTPAWPKIPSGPERDSDHSPLVKGVMRLLLEQCSHFAWCSYSRSATVQRPLDKLGEVFDRRVPMPIYISRGRFTTDAVKDMMAKPENREEAVSNLFKSVGGRLIGWYLTFGPHDWLVIGEFPDNKAAASAVLAAAGGGSLSDVETTVAMTAAEAKATFEAAGKVAEDFRSAGRS
jgi:uncharacterized protein with GYD domain